jgi:hypothetical protein
MVNEGPAILGLQSKLLEPRFIAILFCVALLRVTAIVARIGSTPPTRQDFTVYYLTALALHQGDNPYTTSFSQIAVLADLGSDVTGEVGQPTDPPTFFFIIEPLAFMSRGAAFWTWAGLNAVCMICSLLLLTTGLSSKARAALVALAVIYPPVGIHFIWGQSKILILLLFTLAIRLMNTGRDRLAGLCLAAASLLRIFPLLLLGYLLIQRRWSALRWTIIGLAGGAAATLLAFGWVTCLSFASGLHLIRQPTWLLYRGNLSIRALVFQIA